MERLTGAYETDSAHFGRGRLSRHDTNVLPLIAPRHPPTNDLNVSCRRQSRADTLVCGPGPRPLIKGAIMSSELKVGYRTVDGL